VLADPPRYANGTARLAFEIVGFRAVSGAEIEEATALFRRRAAISRADRPYSSREEFAIGIYQLELRDAQRKAFARRKSAIPTLRNPLDASRHERDDVGGEGDGFGVIVGGEIALEEWDGFKIKDYPMRRRADQDLCARILAKSPGRKRGRPPIGAQAMSDKERKQRQRQLREQLRLLKEGLDENCRAGNLDDSGRDRGQLDRGGSRPEPVIAQAPRD
jgi:hypothetical protein